MKYTRYAVIALPLIAFSFSLASFSYSYIQAKPMLSFVAPASASTLKNPLKGDATATAAGAIIYAKQCAPCHGTRGRGDGPASYTLTKAPANHTADQVQDLTDGALYWMITNGNAPMPAYSKTLNETQRWQLVDFIRTLARKK